LGIESFEFYAGVICRELPIGFGMMFVSVFLPSGDFALQGRLVGNAAAQALARQNAEFGFGHVEPTSMFGRVVPFESLYEAARFVGGESRIERGRRVRAEIVLNQHDLFGVGKMQVGEFFQHLRVIDGGVVVGDLDFAPALQRREHHEYVGDAVALVFVVVPGDASRLGGIGLRVSTINCFEVSSTHTRGRSGSRGFW